MKTKFIAEDRKYYSDNAASIFRELEDCLDDYRGVIGPNWCLSLKCISGGCRYLMIEASEGNDSDFAAAKMSTLEKFSDMAVVGVQDLEGLKSLLNSYYIDKENEELQKIIKAADLHPKAHPKGILNTDSWEWLRTQARISPWSGGIRVPYSMIICDARGTNEVKGEILITFSGATEHYDLTIVIRILRALQTSWAITQKNIQHTYHLEKLREHKIVNILFNTYGIYERDRYTVA